LRVCRPKALLMRSAARPADTFEISRNDLLKWSELFEPPTDEELALYDPPGLVRPYPM
jgi:hypothetical protein